MRIIFFFLFGGAVLSAGLWIFFDSLVLVWVGILGSIAKGSLFTFFLAMVKRWFLVELPKLVLKLLLRIGIPIRVRAKIRHTISVTKNWVINIKEVTVFKAQAFVGERTALTLAILATVAISVLTFIFWGAYILWIVGPARILQAFRLILGILLRPIQNFVFKFVANTGLFKLWDWAKRLLPSSYNKLIRSLLVKFVRKRKHVTRKIEEKMKENKKEEEM